MKFGIAVFLIVFVVVPVTYIGWTVHSNRTYASELFAPITYENVVASRRWHLEVFGCTFGVVSLGANAPDYPPEELSGRRFPYNMPSDWQPTPGIALNQINMGWFAPCEEKLAPPLFKAMSDALTEPGGWWATNSEYVFLYSKSAKLAFRLRMGD